MRKFTKAKYDELLAYPKHWPDIRDFVHVECRVGTECCIYYRPPELALALDVSIDQCFLGKG